MLFEELVFVDTVGEDSCWIFLTFTSVGTLVELTFIWLGKFGVFLTTEMKRIHGRRWGPKNKIYLGFSIEGDNFQTQFWNKCHAFFQSPFCYKYTQPKLIHNCGESTSNYKVAEKNMTLIPQLGVTHFLKILNNIYDFFTQDAFCAQSCVHGCRSVQSSNRSVTTALGGQKGQEMKQAFGEIFIYDEFQNFSSD